MPTNVELYNEADRLKDEGKLPEAVEKLQELLTLAPNDALAHAALAVNLGKLGRHDEAIEHAKTVCRLEPDDAFSYTALSVCCQRAGRIMEAEDALARARIMHGH
jgi:Flp pilus assembly protein TadD